MRIVSAHKVLAAIIGALVLVALCAGTAMAVTTATNNHNAAVQRDSCHLLEHNRAAGQSQGRCTGQGHRRRERQGSQGSAGSQAGPAGSPQGS